jgi:hypothetical protein
VLPERATFKDFNVKKYYLHLSAYSCDKCAGPVVSGSTAMRENEISRETEVRQVGAVCLSCRHQQSKASGPGVAHDFPPTRWESPAALGID